MSSIVQLTIVHDCAHCGSFLKIVSNSVHYLPDQRKYLLWQKILNYSHTSWCTVHCDNFCSGVSYIHKCHNDTDWLTTQTKIDQKLIFLLFNHKVISVFHLTWLNPIMNYYDKLQLIIWFLYGNFIFHFFRISIWNLFSIGWLLVIKHFKRVCHL